MCPYSVSITFEGHLVMRGISKSLFNYPGEDVGHVFVMQNAFAIFLCHNCFDSNYSTFANRDQLKGKLTTHL